MAEAELEKMSPAQDVWSSVCRRRTAMPGRPRQHNLGRAFQLPNQLFTRRRIAGKSQSGRAARDTLLPGFSHEVVSSNASASACDGARLRPP
jgi:hypothetical protein